MATSYLGALLLALELAGVRGVTDEPAQAEPVVAAPAALPPPRPASVPNRVPGWAWAMFRWHDDVQARARPLAAPQMLPGWYWEWRAWRKGGGA